VLLLESDLATSLSFRFSGFDGRREVRRSRGTGIALTDGVDWAAGSEVNDDRDRLNALRTLKAVGGGDVAELGVCCWPKSKLVLGVETPSVPGLRVSGHKSSKGEEPFSAY